MTPQVSSPILSGTRTCLAWAMSILASCTVLGHVSQVAGISFQAFSWALAVLTVAVTAGFVAVKGPSLLERYEEVDKLTLFSLLLISLVGALLGLLSFRPDPDDFYYAPNAVYYLKNPGASMGFIVHFIQSESPIISRVWGTSLPYEYARAAVAYITGADFLTVYYFFTSTLVGGIIPLSYFYLLAQLTNSIHKAVFGTFVAVALVLFMGDTHRAPGNFAFVRAFQGKTLLIAAGIPLFSGATLEFFREASVRAWILLFVTATGLIGATASTAVLLLALASVLAFAVLLTRRMYKETIRKWVPYGASLLYVVSYAILLVIFSTNDLGVESPVNEGWPTTFWGHAGFFLDIKQPVTPVLVLVGTVVALIYGIGRGAYFVALWCIFAVSFYINPLVSNFYISELTSPNIYWRLFYIYPVIPILGGGRFLYFGLGGAVLKES